MVIKIYLTSTYISRFKLSDFISVVICTILHKVAAIFRQITGKFKIDEQLDNEARYKGIILKR